MKNWEVRYTVTCVVCAQTEQEAYEILCQRLSDALGEPCEQYEDGSISFSNTTRRLVN